VRHTNARSSSSASPPFRTDGEPVGAQGVPLTRCARSRRPTACVALRFFITAICRSRAQTDYGVSPVDIAQGTSAAASSGLVPRRLLLGCRRRRRPRRRPQSPPRPFSSCLLPRELDLVAAWPVEIALPAAKPKISGHENPGPRLTTAAQGRGQTHRE